MLSTVSTANRTDLVAFGDIGSITSGVYLNLEIPTTDDCVQAEVFQVEFQDEDNYMWSGQTEDGDGLVILVKENGYLGGVIRTDVGKAYTIHPLNTQISILVEDDLSVPSTEGITSNQNNAESDREEVLCNEDNEDCTSTKKEVKVLFLAPNNSPPFSAARIFARIYMGLTDIAFKNSGISNIALSWVVREIDFQYANDNTTSLPNIAEDLTELKTDQEVLRMRDEEKADLVFLLTRRNYRDPNGNPRFGIAEADTAPQIDEAFSIVETNVPVTAFTFTHELGHLFGAEHQRGADGPNAAECCHGLDLGRGTTVMHTNTMGTILVFTNADPAIATGDSRNNNALCIENGACVVSTYYARANRFSMDYTFSPDCVGGDDSENQEITFTAEINEPDFGQRGQPPYTYIWQYNADCCTNGYQNFRDENGNQLTEEQAVFNTNLVNNQPFSVRLTVNTSDGYTFN